MDDMWLSLTWKSYFIMFLHRCEAMDHDDSSFKKIEVLSDAELVEVAHEKEHAIVHVFGQCRKKDDKE